MELKKQIQTSGNSAVVRLTSENMKLYGLKIGDIIFITIETEQERERNNSAFAKLAGRSGGHVLTKEEKASQEKYKAELKAEREK